MMINNDDESFNSTSTHDSSRNNNEDAHRATGDFVIHLPTDVLLEHMIPFLDRQSICCLGRTNQKWNMIYKKKMTTLPWPNRLLLSYSSSKRSFSSTSLTVSTKIAAATCLAFSPDNRHLVVGRSDGSISQWNVKYGQLPSLVGHYAPGTSSINAIAYSNDGKFLASASSSNVANWRSSSITIWCCCSTTQQEGSLPEESPSTTTTKSSILPWKQIDLYQQEATCLAFSPNNDFLVSGHAHHETKIKLWSLIDGSCMTEFSDHNSPYSDVLSVEVSIDAQRILTTTSDGMIKVWNIANRTYDQWVGCNHHYGGINAVGQSQSGGLLIASSSSSSSSSGCAYSNMMYHDDASSSPASSTSTSSSSYVLNLWNREQQETTQLVHSDSDNDHPYHCCFSKDGKKLVKLHKNQNAAIRIYNVATGKEVIIPTPSDSRGRDEQMVRSCNSPVHRSLAFSNDSTLLAVISSSERNQIQLIRI